MKDLRADRIGAEVRLTWTTPANSTDDLPLKQAISAEICRQLGSDTSFAAPCTIVQHLPVVPGLSTAIDPLPPDLLADPIRLLHYHVRLLNPAGRSADPSNPAFAATGQAPSPIAGLHPAPSAAGTRLLWLPASRRDAAVLLDRTTTSPAPSPHPPRASGKPPGLPASKPVSPVTIRLEAAPVGPDPGGTRDPSTQRDATYTYIAWRSRSVQLAGKTLTLRSPVSAPLTLTVRDTTPPAAPTGLQAIVDDPSASHSSAFVDLSWEPGSDPDLAGYWVERATFPATTSRPAAAASSDLSWQRLNPTLLPGPSFRDLPPSPGAFRYRLLAVDATGNVSPPSPALTVTIP